MLVCKWNKLPQELQRDEVKPYWSSLRKKNISLLLKRLFDIIMSFVLLVLFSWLFVIIAVAIKIDSKGPVFYRQVRITQYGKKFRIHKFRSMYVGSDKGNLVTVNEDDRITKVGKFIRKFKLDEISQVIDVFFGKMSFVGTRPEVEKYVEKYSNEMMATLLLPAGITSMTSLLYKDENSMLEKSDDVDATYINEILPLKMEYNLLEIKKFGLFRDLKIMIKTVFEIL